MVTFRRALTQFGALLLAGCAAAQATPPANYDEAKVGSYTLPDPLVFSSGRPVRDARDWQKRRAELIALFEENVYGRAPRPRKCRFEVVETDADAFDGKAIRKQVTLYFTDRSDGPKLDLLIYLPKETVGPVPLILSLNFSGNHTVVPDPGV